jgi:hypothetical protein
MSNSNDINEQSGSPRDSRNSGVTSGLNTQCQVPAPIAKQTNHNALVGSNQGDHRAPNSGAGTTDSFKSQAGPRGETTTTELEGA